MYMPRRIPKQPKQAEVLPPDDAHPATVAGLSKALVAMQKQDGPNGGRPRFVATDAGRAVVFGLISTGCTIETVARILNIDRRVLTRLYPLEINEGTTIMVANVAGAAYRAAMAGDTGQQRFILKCKAGWREKDDEKPYDTSDVAAASTVPGDGEDLRTISAEKWEELVAMAQRGEVPQF